VRASGPLRGAFDREFLEVAISSATVVVGLLYGYGWIILAQFYGRFGLIPEDVGVTFAFVTVRVAFVVAILFFVLAIVEVLLRRLRGKSLKFSLPKTSLPLDALEFQGGGSSG
jgi:hypothetical protein